MRAVLSVLCILIFYPHLSLAQTFTCGSDVVDNQAIDAGLSLSNCIRNARASVADAASIIIEIPAGKYYISGTVDLGSLSNTRLRTQTGQGTCFASAADACAILIARPENPGPTILRSTNSTNLYFERIAIDGNIGPRRTRFTSSTQFSGGKAYNSMIHNCQSCTFLGFASVRAAQGTGMEFFGDNAGFYYSNFSHNGWGITSAQESWSDGLTVTSSSNLTIVGSRFFDNSDVDLIVGNAPHLNLQDNKIGNSTNFAFAALMLDNFNGSQLGDFSYANISGNSIDCGSGYCGIGINLGPKIWYASTAISGYAAAVTNNHIVGAKQGILNDHANGFNIINNTIDAQGAYEDGSNCVATPIASTPGDSVLIEKNNYNPFTDSISMCTTGDLPNLVVHIPDTSLEVSRIYHDILGRNPDATGGHFYTSAQNVGYSLNNVRILIAYSQEAADQIDKAYRDILGRPVDAQGLASWQSVISSGTMTLDRLRPALATSAEANLYSYRMYTSLFNW